jgi:hypothetical protein
MVSDKKIFMGISNQDSHQAKNRKKRGMKLKKKISSETTEPISTKLC